jgi:hypothetical protein
MVTCHFLFSPEDAPARLDGLRNIGGSEPQFVETAAGQRNERRARRVNSKIKTKTMGTQKKRPGILTSVNTDRHGQSIASCSGKSKPKYPMKKATGPRGAGGFLPPYYI